MSTKEKWVTIKIANDDSRLPVNIKSEIVKKVGSRYNSKTKDVLIGLDEQEQKYILPKLIRQHNGNKDVDYETKVSIFFAELDIPVVYGAGKRLNIATVKKQVDVEKVKGENGAIMENPVFFEMPVNPLDYTIYKQCIADDSVAVTEHEHLNLANFKFVLIDENKDEERKNRVSKSVDQLDMLRLGLIRRDENENFMKPEKVDAVVRLLGRNPQFMSDEEKSVFLKDETNRTIKVLEEGTKLEDTKFYTVVKDPDLGIKSNLMIYVQLGILEKEGEYFRDPESGTTLGANINQAVAFVKDANNNQLISKWKFKHQSIVKEVVEN